MLCDGFVFLLGKDMVVWSKELVFSLLGFEIWS